MILLISPTPGRGHGAERMLASLLEAWPDAAATFVMLAPAGSLVFRVAQRLGMACTPLQVRGSVLGNLAALREALHQLPDCRVVHGWTALAFELAAMVSLRRGLPYTLTLHDHPRADYFSRSRQGLLQLASARAGGIVCVSEAVRAACEHAGYAGPLRVIRNGLPVGPVLASSAATVRVGFLGMEHAHKGFSTVKAWAGHLPPLASLYLYGHAGPEDIRSVETLAIAAEGRVRYLGNRVPETIFGELDAIVHPSLVFDSFPTVLLEAARAGLPVVASDVGGAREIVEHGITGWLFDLSAPDEGRAYLRRLVEDPACRRTMGAAARGRFLREFVVERMIDAYRALWSSL